MSLFSRILGRNSTYVLGIVVAAFVIDRTVEIGAEYVWKTANKGVSIHFKRSLMFWNGENHEYFHWLDVFSFYLFPCVIETQLTFEEIKDKFTE